MNYLKLLAYFRFMSDVQIIKLNAVSIYLMELIDNQYNNHLNHLNFTEIERHVSIKNEQKKREFAATRYLKHRLFGSKDILYSDSGTPYIDNEGFISISHSSTYVGIAVCKQHPIGFDIEQISTKALRVESKFCSDSEQVLFDHTSAEEMTLLWSFKETLYKLSDRKELLFKKDIRVTKTEDAFIGEVKSTTGFFRTKLTYAEFQGNYITCNHSPVEQINENT